MSSAKHLYLSIRFLPLLALAFVACRKKPESTGSPAAAAPSSAAAPRPNLAALGTAPDWKSLDAYQETITRTDFLRLLEEIYCQPQAWATTLFPGEESVGIRTLTSVKNAPMHVLQFAGAASNKPPKRYWRPAAQLPPIADPAKPLEGLHVAIDPGHIGGRWAKMEERWFQIGAGTPVREGDMTLATAKILQPLLEAMGARVSLVRRSLEPVTPLRPADFKEAARLELEKLGIDPDNPPAGPPTHALEWQQEKLFYRAAEIRARAEMVNARLRPDLVVCLHFNAEAWGNPASPSLTTRNHLHLIVHGGCTQEELTLDDQRHQILLRLLQRTSEEEVAVSEAVGQALAAASGLPPYVYSPETSSMKALPVAGHPYLWARNLLANRLYQCPVVYCEPYVMNCQDVYDRVQAGDYEGSAEIGGKRQPSIFREYAQAVAAGLRSYYSSARVPR
jgi:N-acetylmuramoyl-L-alanine amidase